VNKTRAGFAEKFEELIEGYNADSRNLEELLEELLKLSRNLSDEQEHHVRDSMSEAELAVFDILTRPAPELNAAERAEVKKVARDLLNRIKQLVVLNWRQKSSVRSQVNLATEDVLDTGLPASTRNRFSSKSAPPSSSTSSRVTRARRGCLLHGGLMQTYLQHDRLRFLPVAVKMEHARLFPAQQGNSVGFVRPLHWLQFPDLFDDIAAIGGREHDAELLQRVSHPNRLQVLTPHYLPNGLRAVIHRDCVYQRLSAQLTARQVYV